MRVLTSTTSIGTIAALLTSLEFVLSVISGLSARATVHGFWLIGLHRGGEAELIGTTRLRRLFIKNLITTSLGVWLVTGVALVESNLQSGVRILDTEFESDTCVSVYGHFYPERPFLHKPPFRAHLEPWVVTASRQIDCGNRGIASLGTGGTSDHSGSLRDMTAPVCASITVRADQVSATIKTLKAASEFLHPVYGESEGFIIFPHDGSNVGKRIKPKNDGEGPCGERGISGYQTELDSHFETVFFHADNMTRAVHEQVCTLHGRRPVSPLPDDMVRLCMNHQEGTLESACLRFNAQKDFINRVRLTNVSALFVSDKTSGASHVCLSASIDFEYVFINHTFIKAANRKANATLPVMVPTIVQTVSGHCERTVAVLGQAALVFTFDAKWSRDDIAKLPLRTMYYGFMMTASMTMFPLHTLRGKESPRFGGPCFLHPVSSVTEIPLDWRLWILISGLILVLLVVVIGSALRVVFSGEVWEIGSAEWSLTRLLGDHADGKEERKAHVQVVPVELEKCEDECSQRLGGAAFIHALSFRKESSAAPDDGSDGIRGPSVLQRRRFEYRVRTGEYN